MNFRIQMLRKERFEIHLEPKRFAKELLPGSPTSFAENDMIDLLANRFV